MSVEVGSASAATSDLNKRRGVFLTLAAFAIFSGTDALLLAGHGLLIRAFRIAEASVVAPFQYSQIIWGCLYGALPFSAPIEIHTLAGAVIIIVSGWLVLK